MVYKKSIKMVFNLNKRCKKDRTQKDEKTSLLKE